MIDDEPMVREVVREYLAEEGHRIDMAEDGRLGLEKFLTGRYDLVLTDKSMPGMTGDQLARAIKAVSPAQRVILLTGLGDLAGGAEDPPEGVDLVIHKPVRFSALNEAIVKVMASAAS